MLRLLKAAWILFWAILLTLILFFPQRFTAPRSTPGSS